MNAGKIAYKGKKLLSCMLIIILIILQCDNIWADEPMACAVGDRFTEGDLEYRVIDADNMYVAVSGLDTQDDFSDRLLDIPANVLHDGVGYSVTEIGSGAFRHCTKISTVNIPYGVKVIGSSAFNESSLTYVSIPSSVKTIDMFSFYRCKSLQNVTIPESVETIGEDAFEGCSSLTKIIISEGVKEIGYGAFFNCVNVDTISLPGSLETMGGSVFGDCGKNVDELTVSMKEGMKEIGISDFRGCSNLKEIIIPSTVETIGKSAFSYCTALENVIINTKRITQIENDTFNNCTSLKSIEMPNSVTVFNEGAFSSCTSLREMRIDVNVKKEDKNPVTAIILDEEAKKHPFHMVPTDRKIVFLNSDGTKELAGTSLIDAQKAYIEADDGDTTDNLWWKWKIGDLADLYTVTVEVEKDGEKWKDHGKTFLLKNENDYLIDDFKVESGTYTVCVKIGEAVIDTGVTVEVEDSDTNVTIEYFTVTFYDDDTAYENNTVWGQQIVRKGDYAVKPDSNPVKEKFKFADWKTDKEGSKSFDFGAGITDTTDIYASWSMNSEDTTEPEKPTDTEKPTSPSKPTDTENPSVPSNPTDTENPSVPSNPTDTENPSVPSNPTDTENPSAPSKPSGTENPPVPSNPTNTENPTDSSKPTDTETTITPNKTSDTEVPSTPSPSPSSNGSPELEEPEASAPISGAEKGEKPKTGDTNHVQIYATAAMIAGLSYVMLIFAKRKEGMTEEEKNIRVSALIEWSKKGSWVRKYVALTAIFFLLFYYHSIGKRLDLEWEEICGK